MELIAILVIIVSVLTLLSGLTVFLGAEKYERRRSLMFFLSTIAAAVWSFSIIVFLTLPDKSTSTAEGLIFSLYISPLVMVLMQVFYTGWHVRYGKIVGIIFTLLTAVMSVLLIINPGWLYGGITLSSSGNTIGLRLEWYYVCYSILIALMLATFIKFSLMNAKTAGNKTLRMGNLVYVGALVVSGAMALICSLILPGFGYFRAIWIGPLMLSIAVIVHFYAILRYRLLFLSNVWLRIGSYIILISVAAMVYMIIFFMVFSLLFKVEKIDTEIVLMNFVMIVIMLLIMPVFNEATGLMRSLISAQNINMTYIVKKLNMMATQNVSLNDLALFLADNLHFKYIGLIVDKKVYGSNKIKFSKEEVAKITMLSAREKSVWQEMSGDAKKILEEKEIVAIAELRNAKGRPFGQILVGKPSGKLNSEKKDLEQLESLINLVASIIDSEKRLKA